VAQVELPALSLAAEWTTPRHVETIEWFASARDLCGVHAFLVERREEEAYEKALEALSLNQGGLGIDEDAAFVGYKGGSAPGVMVMSWIVEDSDGVWYSLTVGANHEEAILGSAIHDLARGAARLLIGVGQ
jgi:hypothetical protein